MSAPKFDGKVDIVVPVYNAFGHLTVCIESIFRYSDLSFDLYLINDASDDKTSRYLLNISKNKENIYLLENKLNLGFIKTVNRGLALSKNKYVVLLNSDTIVTHRWLSKLVVCAESDSKIGIINPISNSTPPFSVDMYPGGNPFTMNEKLEVISKRKYPDIVTATGFCLFLKREVIQALGYLDEIYGAGYCEESDYCMRALSAGWRVVADDATFIFHKGEASFKNSYPLYKKNLRIFLKRWGCEYREAMKKPMRKRPLDYLKRALYPPVELSIKRNISDYLAKTYGYLRQKGLKGFLQKVVFHLRTREFFHNLRINRQYFDTTLPSKKKKASVSYVVNEFTLSGGFLEIVQVVNGLVLAGVDAKIITYGASNFKLIDLFTFYSKPIIYSSKEEMIKEFPPTDIAIATFWSTAYDLKKVKSIYKKTQLVYFIQDFEPWFYPAKKQEDRGLALGSYHLIKNRIVTSQFLKDKMSELNLSVTKIGLGVNTYNFYSRKNLKSREKVILAMARPSTPRRGFEKLINVLALVHGKVPDLKIALFGDNNLRSYKIPFPFTNLKKIYDSDTLADYYSQAQVFVDCSLFHGFGRTGLEAMACETACVLSGSGGVSEYAKNNRNCFLVEPGNVEQTAEKILMLLSKPNIRFNFAKNGLETAQTFSVEKEIRATWRYFKRLKDS